MTQPLNFTGAEIRRGGSGQCHCSLNALGSWAFITRLPSNQVGYWQIRKLVGHMEGPLGKQETSSTSIWLESVTSFALKFSAFNTCPGNVFVSINADSSILFTRMPFYLVWLWHIRKYVGHYGRLYGKQAALIRLKSDGALGGVTVTRLRMQPFPFYIFIISFFDLFTLKNKKK